jgi:hypothetical protein
MSGPEAAKALKGTFDIRILPISSRGLSATTFAGRHLLRRQNATAG